MSECIQCGHVVQLLNTASVHAHLRRVRSSRQFQPLCAAQELVLMVVLFGLELKLS